MDYIIITSLRFYIYLPRFHRPAYYMSFYFREKMEIIYRDIILMS